MKLWFLTLLLFIVIEITALSSITSNIQRQYRNEKMDRKFSHKSKQNWKQTNKISSSQGRIGQIWLKMKRLVESLYNNVFQALNRFFDGRRTYTWKLFGKRIQIIMPRMPRSYKEARKRAIAFQKAIRRNPVGRCLAAIYVNIAVFTITYAVLFLYNIHCYFCYRRAQVAARDGGAVFKQNHVTVGSNLARNLPSAIKKVTMSAARRLRTNTSESPTGTILQEDEEVAEKAEVNNAMKQKRLDETNLVEDEIDSNPCIGNMEDCSEMDPNERIPRRSNDDSVPRFSLSSSGGADSLEQLGNRAHILVPCEKLDEAYSAERQGEHISRPNPTDCHRFIAVDAGMENKDQELDSTLTLNSPIKF